MLKRRKHLLALLALGILCTLAFSASGALAGPRAKAAIQLTDGVIGPPPISSSLYANVATQEGFFKKLGLDMSFKYYGHGTDVAKTVLSGDEQVGFTATSAVIQLIASGAPLEMLVGMNNADWVLGTSEPGVTNCQSLKGQKIGTDGTNNARELWLAALLKTCGLTINDVTQVSIGAVPADIAKAAIAGQVKTDVLHASEFAEVSDLSKPTPWHTVPTPPSLLKQFHYLVGFTTEHELQTNRDAVVRFVAAYILARQWMADPKNQAAFDKLAAKAQGTSLSVATTAGKILAAIPYWAPGIGLSKVNLGNNVKTLVAINTISSGSAPGYSTMVDTSVYRDALKLAKKYMPASMKTK